MTTSNNLRNPQYLIYANTLVKHSAHTVALFKTCISYLYDLIQYIVNLHGYSDIDLSNILSNFSTRSAVSTKSRLS